LRRFALALAFFVFVGAPAYADRGWTRPVNGPVARSFDPPQTRYGPGHLGVDLRAAPGTPVHAAGDGTVTFAGDVAHTLHVVVTHDNGWRTSYSFLRSIAVHEHQPVHAGQILGTTGGTGEQHEGGVLHFGLRVKGAYVDPLLLFRVPDLTTLVHLAPLDAPAPPDEPSGLISGLPPSDNPVVCPSWNGAGCP
jgi:murein DD-endopeptidase MepM/ murein hydrolase activator NlpD